MARIRTIKPEVLEDEIAAGLSDAAWRVWVSSWVLADDHGRFRAGARLLAAAVWQDTSRADDATRALAELAAVGLVTVYQDGSGQRYAQIKPKGWSEHQRIDKPSKPRVLGPNDSGALVINPRELLRGLARVSETLDPPRETSPLARARLPGSDPIRGGAEGSPEGGDQETEPSPPSRATPGPSPLAPLAAKPTPTARRGKPKSPAGPRPAEWALSAALVAFARSKGFDRDELEVLVDAWKNHHDAKGNVFADWDASLRTWISNQAKWDVEKGIEREDLGPEPVRREPALRPVPKAPMTDQARAALAAQLGCSVDEIPTEGQLELLERKAVNHG